MFIFIATTGKFGFVRARERGGVWGRTGRTRNGGGVKGLKKLLDAGCWVGLVG